MEKQQKKTSSKSKRMKRIYRLADSLIECLYINVVELANTGDSF